MGIRRVITALWRLVIAALCFTGTYEGWTVANKWVYFTFQTSLVLGIVMLWAGAATLLDGVQPPAWLKGCVTMYTIIVAVVAYLLLAPPDPATTPHILGIMTTTMVHRIAPVMAVVDFLLADEHRRFRWHYTLSWLAYFPVYLAFVLIRGWLWPHSGPEPGGNPYPYFFVNLPKIGWAQMGVNVVVYMGAFFVLALVLFLIDRIVPARPLMAVGKGGESRSRGAKTKG